MSKEIKLNEKVSVFGKKGARHLEEGKEYQVHPVHAERLIINNEAEAKKGK